MLGDGSNPDENLESLDDLERNFIEAQVAEGYKEGYKLGTRDGQRDGELLGSEEGSKKGSELGYLYGFTSACKQLMATGQTNPKSAKLMDDLLKLIDEFPRTNENNCEEKLASVRIKFRQAFLNVPLAMDCYGPEPGSSGPDTQL